MDGAVTWHYDGTVCGLSLDAPDCGHDDHLVCDGCGCRRSIHYRTNDRTRSGCHECGACEGFQRDRGD